MAHFLPLLLLSLLATANIFGEEDRPKAASEDQGVMGAHFIRVGRGRGAVYDWNPL